MSMEFKKSDFRIEPTKGSGPGGQHRNKVETAVRVTHIPTGMVQYCQASRSQSTNAQTAIKALMSKITAIENHLKHEALNDKRREAVQGQRIRSYNFPTHIVKDHRTGETADVHKVLNGNLGLINPAAR